ncbi:MAG: TonB-dependent receptor [Flavobacteriales bacterium]|nr:TonB-dependent receptor [Flavobacteriales bacterium]
MFWKSTSTRNLFHLLILLVCFLGFSSFFAQTITQTIKGKIIDQDTKAAIFGAKIILVNTSPIIGTTSDNDGFFTIEKVPIGRYDVKISYLGYEDVKLQQVQLNSGKELILNIELSESIKNLETVTVKANSKNKPLNEMATVSVRSFNVEETQRYAASFNDPARMAVSFAGVNTSNDASNEIIVRGNSARGMLWRVEGIEIPSPNHFSNGEGGSGGGISILSSQILGSSDFYTGAFPAEYGNALSGVFDIKFRKGNYQKREYSFQVGILGMQTSLEGPFSKKYTGSYLINYRYSTLIMLNAIGLPIVENALVPQFQDVNYNFFFPTKKAGNFTVFGLGGLSTAGELAVKDSTTWEKRSDRYQDNNYQLIGVSGITHTYLFKNQKAYLKTVLAFSSDDLKYRLDSLDNNYGLTTAYSEKFSYKTIRFNSFLNHKFNAQNILRVGMNYSQYFYSILSKGLELTSGEQGTFVDENGNTGLVQAYAQWKYKISDKMDLNTGYHSSHFVLNQQTKVEPRIGFQWRFKPKQSFSAGVGLHSRIEPISVYLARSYNDSINYTQPNFNLGLTNSFHSVAGYDWNFGENTRLKTEIYYQYLFNVPVDTSFGNNESILNFNAGVTRSSFINSGIGRNYGMEITIEKFFSKNYFFLFTGSLFQSEYSLGEGVWRNTRFNGNYMLNALGGYEFKFGKNKKNSIGANTRITLRGGNRYTPINEVASKLAGYEILYTDQAFSKQAPNYFRTDISANIRFNYEKWAFSIAVEIQNVTNRLNINRYFFDPYTKEVRSALMFGIMPVFNFKFEF